MNRKIIQRIARQEAQYVVNEARATSVAIPLIIARRMSEGRKVFNVLDLRVAVERLVSPK